MSEFKGFPKGMQFTPIPNLVFSSLAGLITDIVELKVLLHVFEIIYPKKGNVRYYDGAQVKHRLTKITKLSREGYSLRLIRRQLLGI